MVRGRVAKTTTDDEPNAKIARFSTKIELILPVLPKESGNLLACGQGELGQLGLGESVMEKTRPAINQKVKNIVDVQAGGMHSLCLTNNGEVYSFGCNDEGALGRESTEDGSEFEPLKITLPSKCLKISAGDSHSACLLDDGRVFAWGSFRDSHGNMGLTLEGNKRHPVEVLPRIKSVDIASGADHLVILTSIGKMYTLGCAEQGQLGRISLRSASGESRRGKSELLQPGLVYVKRLIADAIWATTYCTFFREPNSSNIYAFGLNNYNQLGLNKPCDPVFVPKLTKFENVKFISGGQHHTMVLTNDNKCFVIGRKEYGRLGVGEIAEDLEELTPLKTFDNIPIKAISCGDCSSFAITENGNVYAWGMGSNQQLGTGSEEDAITPILLTGLQVKEKNVLKVSGGGQHTLFIVEDKTTVIEPVEPVKPVIKENNVEIKNDNKIAETKNKVVNDVEMADIEDGSDKQSDKNEDVQSKEISSTKRGRKKKN